MRRSRAGRGLPTRRARDSDRTPTAGRASRTQDHALQLRAFALLLDKWRAIGSPPPRPTLVLAGAVRHAADQERLDALVGLSRTLLAQDADAVHFAANLPHAALHEAMGAAAVGLHTMWNEHFGIGVVEMLAAGARGTTRSLRSHARASRPLHRPPCRACTGMATIAHDSGGPALDIIEGGRTGLLATTAQQCAPRPRRARAAIVRASAARAYCRNWGACARKRR